MALASAGAVGRQWRIAAGLPETWRELRGSWGAEGDTACWLRSVTNRSECGAGRGGSGARACQTHAQSMPGTCSMKCQGSLEVADEVGKKQG